MRHCHRLFPSLIFVATTILFAVHCKNECPCGACYEWAIEGNETAAFQCVETKQGIQASRLRVPPEVFRGLSGLAIEVADSTVTRVWSVAEDGDYVVQAKVDGLEYGQVQLVEFDLELNPEWELESIAYAPDSGVLAIGTETESTRNSETILLGEVSEPDQGRPVYRQSNPGTLTFPVSDLFGFQLTDDDGTEGLCITETHLAASLEHVLEQDGSRRAPLGVMNRSNEEWSPYLIELTSEKGLVSALACREREAGRLEFFAIERTFRSMRLLRFYVDADSDHGEPMVLQAELVSDLTDTIPDILSAEVNIEGISILPDDRLLLVTDNQFRERLDPTEFWVLDISDIAQSE